MTASKEREHKLNPKIKVGSDETVPKYFKPKTSSSEDNATIVSMCKKAIKLRSMDNPHAASIIIGEIRSKFIESLQTDDIIDIDALKYLDSILFDDLKYLINSVLEYGAKAISKVMMKRVVDKACKTIDYSFDNDILNEVYSIIDEVYYEFA